MAFRLRALLDPRYKTECFPDITPMWSVQGESENFWLNWGCNCLLGLSLELQPGSFTPNALLWSHHAQEVPTGIYGKPWAQKMSKNVIRQAASAIMVKNSLTQSIIYTFWVRSALISKQFSGSLACTQDKPFLFWLTFWDILLWVISWEVI